MLRPGLEYNVNELENDETVEVIAAHPASPRLDQGSENSEAASKWTNSLYFMLLIGDS